MIKDVKVILASDDSIAIIFEDMIDECINRRLTHLSHLIREEAYLGVIEVVASYRILQVYFEPLTCDYKSLIQWIESTLSTMTVPNLGDSELIEVPVCYDPRLGIDMAYVCKQKGMDRQTLIRLHSERDYRVYMLGFTPGFPYLGGMNQEIAIPRKETPRLKIQRGSVGIAGNQTGIYPLDSPGGWQIIGRTPLDLFNPRSDTPFLLSAGMRLKFKPISYETYIELGGEGYE